MAGLLDDPIAALAAQIRAQYNTGQGGSGSWDDAGYDRAMELAQLLAKQGITNLGELSILDKSERYTSPGEAAQYGEFARDAVAPHERIRLQRQLMIGGKPVGYLGDYNNDGTYGTKSGDYLQQPQGSDFSLEEYSQDPTRYNEDLLGWSATGHGNTSYRVVTGPDGKLVIAPGWNSSSDAESAREAALTMAAVFGAGYGYEALAGAGAGGAGAGGGLTAAQQAAFASPELMGGAFGTGAQLGTAEYAVMAGAGAGGTGGIGTLGNTLPAASGQVAPLELLGQATAPTLSQVATVPTTAELMSGGGLLTAANAGKAASAASTAQSLMDNGSVDPYGPNSGWGQDTLSNMGVPNDTNPSWWEALPSYAKEAAPWLRTLTTAAGAYEGYKGNDPATSTNVRTLDPRIDSRVFGDGGLLSNADSWYQQNKSGQNEQMKKSQDWLRGMLSSPEAQQGLARMYGSSQGLLSQPVAGNPFLNWKIGG